jgi:hypothetical protein
MKIIPNNPLAGKIKIKIKNSKLRGEWAELRFATRAAEQGFVVSRPWGDSAPYDFLIERRGRVQRVQVKCTQYKRGRSYKCHVTHNGIPYLSTEVDFIAAYVIEADLWYLIPTAATKRRSHVMLAPYRQTSEFAPHKEAWHLLL